VGIAYDNGHFAKGATRGPSAPTAGNLRQDIPLDGWNRYQLSNSVN